MDPHAPPRPPTPPPFRGCTPPPAAPEWTRVFHTALVSTRSSTLEGFSRELAELSSHPAFHALLRAAETHGIERSLSPRQACEELVRVFRRLDQLWTDYVSQEGLDRIRAQVKSGE